MSNRVRIDEGLETISIYRDKRGDRKCPNCREENIEITSQALLHNRTELALRGYCPDCGCSFNLIYVLHISDITFS